MWLLTNLFSQRSDSCAFNHHTAPVTSNEPQVLGFMMNSALQSKCAEMHAVGVLLTL
jgi:hypothetical protein